MLGVHRIYLLGLCLSNTPALWYKFIQQCVQPCKRSTKMDFSSQIHCKLKWENGVDLELSSEHYSWSKHKPNVLLFYYNMPA